MVTWYNVLVKEAPELLKKPAKKKKKDDSAKKS